MGRFIFKLPDVGEGTAEAEIVAWHVQVGQTIEEDAPLVDVMTDKATVEMTSPVAGTVLEIVGAPGDMAPVGSAIATLEVEGPGNAGPEPRNTAPQGDPGLLNPAKDLPSHPPAASDPSGPSTLTSHRPPDEKPLASPAVRRRAEALGVTLSDVPGGAPGGRIDHADLDAYLAGERSKTASLFAGASSVRTGVEAIKVIGLRRKIAEKMQEAKRRIPHFAYVEEIDMTALEVLRAHLNGRHPDRVKLTVLPFFMRALAKTLPDYPQINARFDDEAGVVHRYAAVHIGIATQTPGGLTVPVVRHAESLDLWRAAAEVARLSQAARAGKLKPEELTGSTITLTSLGPLGGIATTPVINYPEVAIVGPNKIVDRPVVQAGQIVVRKMMNLSSSFDHRVIDGYDAAAFIQSVKTALEHPATLFMN